MLTLMLLRHAKSSRDDASLADRDRSLSTQGKRAAQAIGRALASLKTRPELVLCSPARRAAETWDLAKAEVPGNIAFQSEEQLYDFGDGQNILECLKAKAGDTRCVLAVGHNPAFHELAKYLVGSGDKALRAKLERKFPTGALAVIVFRAASWQEVAEAAGELKRFIRPKDILAGASD
jgi:phosphohistidine phosphatase